MIFVIPNPTDFISGGNSYNLKLIDAIHEVGGEVSHITYKQFRSTPVSTARYIFDTIYFEDMSSDDIALPDGAIGLIHHLSSLYPLSDEVFEKVDRPILQMFTAFVVSSQFTKEYLRSQGLNQPIAVIEPAKPDVDQILPTNMRKEPGPKIKAILVNNIVARKGVRELLEALARESIPPFYKIQIVGDMTIDQAYSKLCTDSVRDNPNLQKTVTFLGSQDDFTVSKLYSRSNLFISASHMETFGMSIQEASILGLPLLVLDGGNAPNHISPGVNGWVETSIPKIAKRIAYLMDNPDEFIKIQTSALNYRHPYIESYREGAPILLNFINKL
jgi:glycosyltransferase involved in cell wall biosynthesis